jgi:tRNA threonylcarbamoyladenosine biosynthesis protein TsaE
MESEKKIIYSIHELDQVAHYLRSQFDRCQAFTFTGALGTGKTTLIRRLLQLSGIEGVITSPTFTYVNVYENKLDQKFYHFDCYRIASLDDFLEAGFGEYLYAPQSWAFIEWPQVIAPLLYQSVCHVTLDYYSDDKRELTCTILAAQQEMPEVSVFARPED